MGGLVRGALRPGWAVWPAYVSWLRTKGFVLPAMLDLHNLWAATTRALQANPLRPTAFERALCDAWGLGYVQLRVLPALALAALAGLALRLRCRSPQGKNWHRSTFRER